MELDEIIKPENLVYEKPKLMNDNPMHYCPGCSHGVIHKLIAEVIADLGLEEKTIGISPVGCAVFAYNYLDIDWVEAAHGRAPAIASAIKRLNPDKMVFTYQGDGDLAAIGTAETIHAANRGENIVIIFVNNAIYGMTGGQMAPTTLEGMQGSPIFSIVSLNACLSSALWIVSGFAPSSFTPFSSRKPSSASCMERVRPVCPPSVDKILSGFSILIIFFTTIIARATRSCLHISSIH